MENSIMNFEKLLNSKSARKSSIYESKPLNRPTYKPQDVLDTVFSQIKCIQQADTNKNNKPKFRETKSGFLVIDNKPVYKEVSKQHKFETQCISDSQLINIIENVEAIDAHKGITQEFDKTFVHTHVNKETSTVKKDKVEDSSPKIKEFKHTDVNVDKTPITMTEIVNSYSILKENSFADVFSQKYTETNIKCMEQVNEDIITKYTTNILEDNIDLTSSQCRDSNMVDIFPKSLKEKDKIAAKTYNQTMDDHAQRIIEINTDNDNHYDKTNANVHNTDGQTKTNNVAFTQGYTEGNKDIQTVINTSCDDSPSVLANENICVLDEQLNTEDIANINDFEKYNSKYELKVNSQEKPIENINVSKELFTVDQMQYNEVVEIKKERTPSPVLNIKHKKAKCPKTSHSFSVPLEVFENFEKTFMSSVESKDKQILINSQILDTELCLNFNTNFKMDDAALSPVIELSNDELHISKKEIEEVNSRIRSAKIDSINEKINSIPQESFFNDEEMNVPNNNNTAVTKSSEKRSDSFKDEILFSSDEENEYAHTEIVDLPLTCALETSFYDEPGILEKTMYVGFQTASNKSIQIQTETFEKARSMLSNEREFSLTELVEICDNQAKNTDIKVQKNETGTKSESNDDRNLKITDQKVKTLEIPGNPAEFEFVGFQTANNKKINISKTAMTKISNVFKDIDLTESFLDSEGKTESKILKHNEPPIKNSNQTDSNKQSTNIQEDNNINDDLLIQEFENIEMSLEEKEANDIKTDFDGFKTASNKKIQISDKAMLNINNIFKDIDLTKLNEDLNNPMCNINEEIGVYPNNSKSTAAANTEYKIYRHDLAFPSTSKANFEGFKTANNKLIKISDMALSKTKNIFKDINDSEIAVNNDNYEKYNDIDVNISNQKFEGFKTASNKSVLISEEAIIKSKKIFQDLEINDNLKTITEPSENILPEITQKCQEQQDKNYQQNYPDIQKSQGFNTASDKSVKVSTNSFAKTRKIFDDLKFKIHLISDDGKDTCEFKGFKTANNNPVIVSEKHLARSRKIFAELDKNNSDVDNKVNTNKKEPYPTSFRSESLIVKGFMTNNKLVKISEESLAKSENIFNDINDETNAIENKPFVKTNEVDNPVFKGFQTANKKPVNISKKALLRSKIIFQDIEQNAQKNETIDANANNIAKTSSDIGFKTLNNKEVFISEDTIEINKTVFDDFKDSTSNEAVKTNKVQFTGFQTASSKCVNISKKAIQKTKNIFKDIINIENTEPEKEKSQDIDTENNKQHVTNIFTTANDKIVPISEKAIKESKQLLTKSVNTETKTKNTSISIENIINTQVLNNFEDNLCTEDFQITPRALKRSTSPILSCPKAKKRKFETPYSQAKQTTKAIQKTEPTKSRTTHFNEDYKKNKIYTLKDLKTVKNKIDPYITIFNIENIHTFEFIDERNDIISNTKITYNDIKTIFQNGVDTKIIPDGWIDIHLKLIIWKLLSYEVKFNFMCTTRNVLNQLKYRYDKELYRAERPALRKIMEKDDVPSKTLVLCVVGIYVDGVSVQSVNTTDNIELLLTDGWYFIKTIIDKMLSRLVYEGKIYIRRKLVINSAELLNCEQGVSPWEDTSQIKLKIFGNSTRPAPWDTKLGYHKSAILTDLTAVKVDGGKICKMQVFVTRVYPLLYVEKFEDGSTVTRSERLEHLHQIKYENDREAVLEQIYEEVQKEFSDQESQDSESYIESGNKRKILESGSQIAKMMKKCKDPMEFRAQLTTSQVQLLQDHTSKNRDKLISAIQNRIKERLGQRNVVTLARGKIASVGTRGGQIIVSTGMLSIWKPNEAILELFKENSWIEVTNVVPTAIRYSELQLSAGRQSLFRQSKPKSDSFDSYLEKYKRKIYKIEELTNKPVNDNEIDTVGLIFLIDPSIKDYDSTKHFQNVYLADEHKNMICINFWGGIKKFGFLNVIDTGQIIACVNLQKRAGNTRKNIPQFRVTEFTSLTKTPKNAQCREMIENLNKKLGTNRVKFCEDCVAIQSNYSVLKSFDDNSPYRVNRSDYNISKNKMFIDTPLRNTKKDEFNLTGLDFESSFKQTETELSPNTLKRKKKVNDKIAKLKMYGEPPPLSPINIVNKSKNAEKSYKSPLITKDNSINNLEASVTVPNNVIISSNITEQSKTPTFNKTYAKRNANPIKLDFSKNIAENREQSDGFVGDFDGSPPLSLE